MYKTIVLCRKLSDFAPATTHTQITIPCHRKQTAHSSTSRFACAPATAENPERFIFCPQHQNIEIGE